MKCFLGILAASCAVLVADAKADLVITEAVYDVCNAATTLNDGNGGNNGEYVIIANTSTVAVDVEGFELDDDGDATDGDGMVINTGGGLFEIAGNNFLVFAGTDLLSWEAEYGPLYSGAQFFNVNDAGLSWQALNNGGDDISFTNSINSGIGYTDVSDNGETILWNSSAMAFEDGGNVSLTCGAQDYVPGTLSASVSGIPEPSSLAVLGGIGLFAFSKRRRRGC